MIHDIMEIGKFTWRTALKRIKYGLKCVEGFMLSLISKFYVFINTCLFVSSTFTREEVIGSVMC